MRNLGVMAHVDAGKTTVSERILFPTGQIHRIGEVHDGQAELDHLPEEQARGITITAAAHTTEWDGYQLNLIDTPGRCSKSLEWGQRKATWICTSMHDLLGALTYNLPGDEQSETALITGDLKSKIDSVWDDFWSGGISNPLEVMEQLTYMLFIKGLDDSQTNAENKANRTGEPIENPIYPEGNDSKGRPYEDLRWQNFKNMGSAKEMFDVVDNHVFPHMQAMADGSTHAQHMEDARLTIPTPALLQKVVDGLDAIPMQDRDTKGDVYEYMLGKIASAGQNGQFRTPRHIIELMVEMTKPQPGDTICDPASGTCGFLVAAGEYLRREHPEVLTDAKQLEHFNSNMFSGFDFDNTMLRIGSMNLQLHGVQNPAITYRDSLAEDSDKDEEAYSLILANPPFAGSLDYEGVAKDLLTMVKTKKTELLFLALFLRLLKPGGRAAVIVPDGVLFGSTKAHKELRRMLVEDQKLDGIVSLPSGVFKPYAGVSTAILFFTKTNSGGTDNVWFYDLQADGLSLDDKRTPLLDEAKLGARAELAEDDHAKNNLPDALARWAERDGTEQDRARTDQSFTVPKADIADNDYDLSINRYKEIVYEEIDYAAPSEIIAELEELEGEIQHGLAELKAMLGVRGEFRTVWRDFVDNVLGRLKLEWGPPLEWERDLCFATANAIATDDDEHGVLMAALDQAEDVIELLWDLDTSQFASESAVCDLMPALFEVCAEYDDELADAYIEHAKDFTQRFNLRYTVSRNCELKVSPTGLVASLVDTVYRLGETYPAVGARLADVRDSISDVETDPSNERRIRDAIRNQFLLAEELVASCSTTSAGKFGDACKELDDWPHQTFSKALATLYGFRNDYPAMGHSGNTSAAKRSLDARDLASTTAILFGFAPYLVDGLDGSTGWTPVSEVTL